MSCLEPLKKLRKMNFRVSGQKIVPKRSIKYLGLVIGKFLHWKTHFTILRAKLERSIGHLAKLRYFVSANLLRIVYYAIFDSYLQYGCEVWGQNKNNSINEISRLQDKALRIICFKDCNTVARPLYNEKRIIRFFDLVTFYNCLFVAGHLNQNLPSSFGEYFTYMANHHLMYLSVKQPFMEPSLSQLNQWKIGTLCKIK